MRKTCLYNEHCKSAARLAPFGGWEMPIQYKGILAEHEQTRNGASIFDISHMGEFELSGPTAATDLERLVTQSIFSLAVGQCRYGFLLNEDGGVLDDLTCYRLGKDRFWLVVNAGPAAADRAWIEEHLSGSTRFEDRSDEIGKIDVQGPASRLLLEQALSRPVPDLKYFRADWISWNERPVLVSRTGYTGEWGYELYLPVELTVQCWRALMALPGIEPAGLGARDTLRLEMGYPLYGHELGIHRTPVAASRGLFTDTQKTFIGREAVMRDLQQGPSQYLCGLLLDSRSAARQHDPVVRGGDQVGEVTSGSLAPSLGRAVAMAYIDHDCAAPGTELAVMSRCRPLKATVTELPFYKEGSARKK